ncbi:MAG: hypothetical protein WAU47_00175 [Desulfobaccales bacterium]
MARRPTIGNNPLDLLVQESHLDSVVPDLVTSPPQGPTPRPAGEDDLQALLAAREKENLALRQEVNELKEQVEELKKRLAQGEPRWVALQRLGGGGG